MSDVELEPYGGWTFATIKALFDGRFADVDRRFTDSEKAVNVAMAAAEKALAAQMAAQEKAILKAEQATEKRFDAIDEAADRRAGEMLDKIAELQQTVNQNKGGSATSQRLQSLLVPAMLSLTSIIVVIVALAHHW